MQKRLGDICRKSIILTSSFSGMTINNRSLSCEHPYKCVTILISNWNELLTKWRNVVNMTKSMYVSPSGSARMNNQHFPCENRNILVSNCDEERLWVCVMLPPPPLLETHVRINNQLDMQMSNQLPFPQTSHPLCHFLWSQMSKLECLVDSPSSSSSSCENQ